MARRLNVLYITADQWRGEALSVRGHPVVRTPHLDALAEDGVLFESHYCQCTPCGPSRASLHTGLYAMTHRSVRNGTPLDARFTNIALEVRKAGYDPALIGYTDTSVDPRGLEPDDPRLSQSYEGVLPGFTPLLLMPTQPVEWVRYLADKGYEVTETPFDMYGPEGGHVDVGGFAPFDAPARYRAEDSDTAFSADRAMDYIAERADAGENWFLHLVFLRPHPPYIAPEPYNRMYDPDDMPPFVRHETIEAEAETHPFMAYRLGEPLRCVDHLDERDQRKLRAAYYGLISEVDHHIGRLIAFLKEKGLYDETLIVFTADHGDMLGDHWMVGKECFFDPAFHVPLIIRAPGRAWDAARGWRVGAFTESVDIMPTILDLLDLEIPDQCDGYSLSLFLRGRTPESWRKEVHWEYDFRNVVDDSAETALGLRFDQCVCGTIRDRRYKYVHFAALPPLLFDIKNDPGELHNLADDPAHATTVLDYAQRMLSWRMNHADRTLTGYKLTPSGLHTLERYRW